MGRRSTTGGVIAMGSRRIRFSFRVNGVLYRPSLPSIPTEANMRRARETLQRIKASIAAGTFVFLDEFPEYHRRYLGRIPVTTRSCSDVFDAFLRHEAARVERGDLAPVTLLSHRRLIDKVWRPTLGKLPLLAVRYTTLVEIADSHCWKKKTYNNAVSALRRAFDFGFQDHPDKFNPARVLKSARIGKKDRPKIDPFSVQDAETLIAAIHKEWGEAQGNYDEFRIFTGLRPSEQIALRLTDYDPVSGVLQITKACVTGVDRDRTKTAEDRRVVLCPRAKSVLEQQLKLRERLVRTGRIDHDFLFFHQTGARIRRLYAVHQHWFKTLKRLPIRYRRPYVARHTSVSWNLMLRRSPLFVAKQHGHAILTMLTIYAAWTEGALPADVAAIRRAMTASAHAARDTRPTPPHVAKDLRTETITAIAVPVQRARPEKPGFSGERGARHRPNSAPISPPASGLTPRFFNADSHLGWRSGRDSNPRPPA